MKDSVTIYDIAKAAGVSASTVSRVMNNNPKISSKTREKIYKIMNEYDFSVNEAARELANSESNLIGIMLVDINSVRVMESACIIERMLNDKGYNCLLLTIDHHEERIMKNIRILVQRNVKAAILMGSTFQNDKIQSIISKYIKKIPVFVLNGYIDMPNVFSIWADEKNGIVDCVDLLMRKGRHKIAYLVDDERPSSQSKTQGFIEGMLKYGYAREKLWIYKDVEASLNGGKKALKQILEDHPEVDGIICSLDIMACGVIQEIRNMNRDVPKDVSVIGVDNSIYAEICSPSLTSLNNFVNEMGEIIAGKLIECLEGKDISDQMVIYPSIVEREST